ncbi:hypothetical protein [Phaeovulum sp. W22_SRMD_FR3]|uniref:hypothetical protein n=1 Tax=Phaeovulum sp. W22_SRMD_FR3 TaxID=3240274 RepID=UPI003F9519C9
MNVRFAPFARSVLALAMALLLALTSESAAVARGQTMLAGQIILCSGAAITPVSGGPEGQPRGTAHLCPDMALTLLAALDLHPPHWQRPTTQLRRDVAPSRRRGQGRSLPVARARAPPLVA